MLAIVMSFLAVRVTSPVAFTIPPSAWVMRPFAAVATTFAPAVIEPSAISLELVTLTAPAVAVMAWLIILPLTDVRLTAWPAFAVATLRSRSAAFSQIEPLDAVALITPSVDVSLMSKALRALPMLVAAFRSMAPARML